MVGRCEGWRTHGHVWKQAELRRMFGAAGWRYGGMGPSQTSLYSRRIYPQVAGKRRAGSLAHAYESRLRFDFFGPISAQAYRRLKGVKNHNDDAPRRGYLLRVSGGDGTGPHCCTRHASSINNARRRFRFEVLATLSASAAGRVSPSFRHTEARTAHTCELRNK